VGPEGGYNLVSQLRTAIRSARKQGWTLYQLGRESGVGRDRLSRFVRGERGLTLEAAGRVCQVLHLRLVSPDQPPAPEGKRPRGRPRKPKGE
jgi:transcriptional regulator with XRE-family HTH domain